MTGIRAESITTGVRAESITTGVRADSITTGIRAESGMTMKKPDSFFAGESDIRMKTTATDILKTPKSDLQDVGLTEKRLKEFNSSQKH
jgi:hypothetical protein